MIFEYNPLNFFEELRFIIELLFAEQLFMMFFAKRRKHFWKRSVISWIVFILLSIFFSFVYSNFSIDGFMRGGVFIGWYVSLTFLTLVTLKFTYIVTISDILFIGIAAFSLQHIEYVVINEVLARGVWSQLTNNLGLYFLICLASTLILYYTMIKIFAQKLKASNGLIYEDRWQTILFFIIMFIILFITAFLGQHIFLDGSVDYSQVNYLGAVYDFFSSVLILVVQYSIFRISTLNREKDIVNHLLYERQKQYELSKENIDIINHKCHDLKHQIHGLKQARGIEFDKYIADVEKSVMFYESVIKTDNEVVNTILTEKSLYCDKHGIKLSCVIDASSLIFMSTLDIYSLLGNALDNAIEAVGEIEDIDRRVVSLNISTKSDFLSIQTNNFYIGEIKMKNGLPETSKRKHNYHGFGIQSMKHLTQNYGGSLTINTNNQIFLLQIVIPIPKDFMKIINKKKNSI